MARLQIPHSGALDSKTWNVEALDGDNPNNVEELTSSTYVHWLKLVFVPKDDPLLGLDVKSILSYCHTLSSG